MKHIVVCFFVCIIVCPTKDHGKKLRQVINHINILLKPFTASILRRWKLNWCDLWIDGSFVFYKTQSRRDYETKVNLKATCVNVKSGLECPSRKELFQHFKLFGRVESACACDEIFQQCFNRQCLFEQMYVHLRVTPERICWLFI